MRNGRRPYVTPLAVGQILAWADAHHRRTGSWPRQRSGPIPEAPGLAWHNVDADLRHGHRGLPGGNSLARLLARARGARNPKGLPPLTVAQVLRWADEHRRRTGRWPSAMSGPVRGAPGLTWLAVDMALRSGHRGLPGGGSLARLLDEHRRDVGGLRAWTPEEDELVQILPPAEAARRTGHAIKAVYGRRYTLGVTRTQRRG
jgi:hypothetical protein